MGVSRNRSSVYQNSESDTGCKFLILLKILKYLRYHKFIKTINVHPKFISFLYFQLFLNCLCNLQNNHILTEIDVERLFCNIPEIYAANRVRRKNNIIANIVSKL